MTRQHEINEALSRKWPIPFLTDEQADEIRREASTRELVIDFYENIRERYEEDRRHRRSRVGGALAAVVVSILGVAMFLLLAICFGAR